MDGTYETAVNERALAGTSSMLVQLRTYWANTSEPSQEGKRLNYLDYLFTRVRRSHAHARNLALILPRTALAITPCTSKYLLEMLFLDSLTIILYRKPDFAFPILVISRSYCPRCGFYHLDLKID